MQRYDEETVVIKYGGHAMGAEETAHGTSPATSCCSNRPRSIRSSCMAAARRSRRCSSGSASSRNSRPACASPMRATIEIVEMVLAGSINKQIVGHINAAGGKAVGLCGKDGNMVIADEGDAHRLSIRVRTSSRWSISASSAIRRRSTSRVLNQILGRELIPVLAPLATSRGRPDLQRQRRHLRRAPSPARCKAKRLLLLTDVPGVLDKSKTADHRSCRSTMRAS